MKRLSKHSALAKTFTQTKKIDYLLFIVVLLLTAFGLLMVYDSSQIQAYTEFGDKLYFFKQQLIWVILGLGALGFFSVLNYKILQKLSLFGFILSVGLILSVFIPGLGIQAGGAHRWLRIFGFTIQPAEIIKLTTIVFLADLFKKGIRSRPFLVVLGIVSLIIGILQKDLGSAIIYNLIALGLYFLAGGRILYFAGLLVLGLLGFVGFVITSSYRLKRVSAFLDPFADPQGFSYHITQILIALGSGGFFGLGVGESRQKYSFIPEVSTDSIFSVIGEEFGFFGGAVLLLVIGFLVVRGFKIAHGAPDNFGKLLASGLTIWLVSQAVVNLASMVSLVPLTGVPLPFISYGGSALLVNLAAVGILLNISKESR